jgi:hypothetical protein
MRPSGNLTGSVSDGNVGVLRRECMVVNQSSSTSLRGLDFSDFAVMEVVVDLSEDDGTEFDGSFAKSSRGTSAQLMLFSDSIFEKHASEKRKKKE